VTRPRCLKGSVDSVHLIVPGSRAFVLAIEKAAGFDASPQRRRVAARCWVAYETGCARGRRGLSNQCHPFSIPGENASDQSAAAKALYGEFAAVGALLA
jgi:hypothetical protein